MSTLRRRLLTVDEYAAATGTKPNTVRKQLREGRLRGRKTRIGWRVVASEATKHERR